MLYDQLVTSRYLSQPLSEQPWVLLFTNPDSIDSKRAMFQYKFLADKYQGTVRFGWVHSSKEELLAATFGVS